MTEEQLHTFFTPRGYILVASPGRYSVFRPQDIFGEQVREGACPLAIFSSSVTDTMTETHVERFFEHCLALSENMTPFDTNQTYHIVTERKSFPEWTGWPIEQLRQALGIDSVEEPEYDWFPAIREQRKMPWLAKGMRVDYQQRKGRVMGIAGAGYLQIQFEGDDYIGLYHPQWELVFYDDEGKVIKDYRKKKEEL